MCLNTSSNRVIRLALLATLAVCAVAAQTGVSGAFSPGARVVLNAHNCYPEHGSYTNRIDRALATGLPVAIELDVAWHTDSSTGKSWSVLSHEKETSGDEPTLDTYFFERVRPLVEKALQDGPARWPVLYLHFNFKTTEREHVQHVLQTLMQYKLWLSSATRNADIQRVSPIRYRPILVMTETDPTERAVFHDDVAVGQPFYVFGSAPGERYMPSGLKRDEQFRRMVSTAPSAMLKQPADNYRRWWNNPWAIVEEGGPALAGHWGQQQRQRLESLVDHAHSLGYLIRFYTLNGHHDGEGQGWGSSYNFGSPEAVRIRWQAAADAGVDFIASDQYEQAGAAIQSQRARHQAR
jgi:hypothetical protein